MQDKTIESRGIRITGLMQGNMQYMKFLYDWFAGYKDSLLKQITCAKFQKAIILPLAWLFIL
ncbi:hypothetical protein CUN63_17170 [Pseudomonas sp. ACM7]|nr:hypothetical protein CUN63_17170 [Pseudomonas sp. ACM7]